MSRLMQFFIIISIFICASGVFAMALTDVGKVCLFSKMTGVIKLDGKPVANAKLIRSVNKSGKKVDETITNEKGEFEFPAIFERTITKFLPQEFVVKQEIFVQYNHKEYKIWAGVKRGPEENTEARGKDLVVDCELNSEKKFIEVDGSPIISLCTWNVEPDVIDTGF